MLTISRCCTVKFIQVPLMITKQSIKKMLYVKMLTNWVNYQIIYVCCMANYFLLPNNFNVCVSIHVEIRFKIHNILGNDNNKG